MHTMYVFMLENGSNDIGSYLYMYKQLRYAHFIRVNYGFNTGSHCNYFIEGIELCQNVPYIYSSEYIRCTIFTRFLHVGVFFQHLRAGDTKAAMPNGHFCFVYPDQHRTVGLKFTSEVNVVGVVIKVYSVHTYIVNCIESRDTYFSELVSTTAQVQQKQRNIHMSLPIITFTCSPPLCKLAEELPDEELIYEVSSLHIHILFMYSIGVAGDDVVVACEWR